MQHEMIQKWARAKFKLPDDAVVEVVQETRSGGFCETCWYEDEVWEVRIPDGRVLETFYDDFADILKEVLDFAQTGKINDDL